MTQHPPNDSIPAISSLEGKVKEWLREQGYPTEFVAADICKRHKFRVFQGYHVRDDSADAPREIDVLASKDRHSKDHLLRVSHVLECKWSQDKPWVVFSSQNAHMAAAACAAQTIGSSFGEAILWAIAGNQQLHETDFFWTPDRPGFSGRQAFSKGVDHFYSAMKSVTSLSSQLVKGADKINRKPGKLPDFAELAFPIIVVDGSLFEAFFDAATADIQVKSTNRVRCHWRGAPSWRFHATLDIVTLDHLDDFLKVRAQQVGILLSKMEQTANELAKCVKERSLKSLNVESGSRGYRGLPPLLFELVTGWASPESVPALDSSASTPGSEQT